MADENNNLFYLVRINGLPEVFVTGKSAATVRVDMRKLVKKPEDVISVERAYIPDIRKKFRDALNYKIDLLRRLQPIVTETHILTPEEVEAMINEENEMTLWKYNPRSGLWSSERKVTDATKDQWMKIFKKDEPNASFVVSKKKPSGKPMSEEMASTSITTAGSAINLEKDKPLKFIKRKKMKDFKEAMDSSEYGVAIKTDKGWKLTFKGSKVDQRKELKKMKDSEKEVRGYRTYRKVGDIVEKPLKEEYVVESINESKDFSAIYDNLKKKQEIEISYKATMGGEKTGKFTVVSKNIVGKAQVGKVTLRSVTNPGGVKYYLYNRNGKVSLAIGDMGAALQSIKEEVERVDELAFPGAYKAAAQVLQSVLDRKKKENSKLKHSVEYYASQVAKQYPGVDTRKLASMVEAKKMKGEDPCWDGYEMIGTKKKNGKEVPNCVKKEERTMKNFSEFNEFNIEEAITALDTLRAIAEEMSPERRKGLERALHDARARKDKQASKRINAQMKEEMEIEEALTPKQKKIDKNKNGKIDGEDLATLRKENADAPFSGPYKKKPAVRKDKYGNVIKDKNVAKHLAKQGMAGVKKESVEQVEEGMPKNWAKGQAAKEKAYYKNKAKIDKAHAALDAQKKTTKEEFEQVDEAKISAMQLSTLKAAYGKIDRIDPDSETYKKLLKLLDSMDAKQLTAVANADIKFLSGLAKNRLRRLKEEVEQVEEGSTKAYNKYQKRMHQVAQSAKKVGNMGNTQLTRAAAVKMTRDKMKTEEVNQDETWKRIETYANKHGGIDKKDMLKVANFLRNGLKKTALKYAKTLDTDPRDWLLQAMGESVEQMDEVLDTVEKRNKYLDAAMVSAEKHAAKVRTWRQAPSTASDKAWKKVANRDAGIKRVIKKIIAKEEVEQIDERAKWRSTNVAKKVTHPDSYDSVSSDYHNENPRSTGMLRATSDTDTPDYNKRRPAQVTTQGPRKGKATRAHIDSLKSKIRGKQTYGEEVEQVDENETFDKKSHQYKTTMKHAKNPSVQQRMAAHDIKPGVKGYRDRVAMLHDLERTKKLKKEEVEQMDERAKWRSSSAAKPDHDNDWDRSPKSTGALRATSDTRGDTGGEYHHSSLQNRKKAQVASKGPNAGKTTKASNTSLKNRIRANLARTRNEEVEQVDEISNEKLMAYSKKASADAREKAKTANATGDKNLARKSVDRSSKSVDAVRHVMNRNKGRGYHESVEQIEEKSVSKAQQRMMGMALAAKRGEMDDASPEVKKMAKSMSTKTLKDFAKTKHKGLPEKVTKESVNNYIDEATARTVQCKMCGSNKYSKMENSEFGNTWACEGCGTVSTRQTRQRKVTDMMKEAKSDYKIYHNQFSDAMREVERFAKAQGYEVDEDDYFRKVASGPRKPGKGKTNSYSIALMKDGKETKKMIQVQVYGMDSGKYELNMYVG